MIQRLHGAMAAVVNGANHTCTSPVLPAVLTDGPFAIRLLPARIDARGMPVLRLVLEVFTQIPCIAVRRTGDGQTTEETVEVNSFKPRLGVCYEALNSADVGWFDRCNRPVDVECVRRRLITWHPVLVLVSGKKLYFDASAETLLDCLRPDMFIAVISETAFSVIERYKSPTSKLVSAEPIPARVRMDDKSRVVFRLATIRDQRSGDIEESGKMGWKSDSESTVRKVTMPPEDLVVDSGCVQFFDAKGKSVDIAVAAQRLAKDTVVLVSGDGEKMSDFYLKAVHPDTVTCVLPFDLSAAWKAGLAQEPSLGQ